MYKPPFLFRFRFQTRKYNMKFQMDVVAMNNADATTKAEALLVDILKPLVETGEVTPGDARPLFYEVSVIDIRNHEFVEEGDIF